MAVLHGSWLLPSPSVAALSLPFSGCLFVWGETWRHRPLELLPPLTDRTDAALSHPFAMTAEELLSFFQSLSSDYHLALPDELTQLAAPADTPTQKSSTARSASRAATVAESAAAHTTCLTWKTLNLAVPSYLAQGELTEAGGAAIMPQLSADTAAEQALFLYPWLIEGICLPITAAIALLRALPLRVSSGNDSVVGSDLRYWSHVARWSLDLMARGKYLPGLKPLPDKSGDGNTGQQFLAYWQPLLDSEVDQVRQLHFVQQMPISCRFYQSAEPSFHSPLGIALPLDAQQLLQNFLSHAVEASIRAVHQATGVADSPLETWLHGLSGELPILSGPDLEPLALALNNWTAPLQYRRGDHLFRTCLRLHPPKAGETSWILEYGLQAIDDPELIVDADTIWENPVEQLQYRGQGRSINRTILQPQETFLMGLGLASRLYPPIEPSLQQAQPRACLLNALQAYEFLKNAAWRLQDSGLGVAIPPSLATQGGWANRLGLKIEANTGKLKQGQRLGLQNLLKFRWELTIGGQTLSKQEFDRLVALNTPLVEINGEWVELRPQDIRAAQTFFASRKDQTSLSLEDALRISTGDTQMLEKLPVVSFEASGPLQELITTLTGNRSLEPVNTPEKFRGQLRPYQSRGVGWLAFLEQWGLGACLADDMGLGKTIQLIAFLLHLQEKGNLAKPTLLICPTSVLGNWEREVKKFGPSLKVLLHHGDQRLRGKAFAKAAASHHLTITSYALVYRDLKDLQAVSWQGLALDEAQNIKNPEAKQSQAARELEADFRIALTGTPVENRLSELWSIMDFLNPGYLGPRNFFQRRFATPIERYGDTASLQTLRSLVQPFILRRLKTDRDIIQDLPNKQENTEFCGLTSEQAALYQSIVDTSLSELEAAQGIQRRGLVLALLVKLKQICNHPDLFLKSAESAKATTQPAFDTRSGKLLRLQEMLEELLAEGDRALIFTQFAEWGKLLQAHLNQHFKQEILFLYGSTPKKRREEMVDRFQHDPQAPRIFILSLKAGGVGLNLTRANHVFHFDRWWNPAVENQATDRVFRIGQTRNVQVHKFVCSGTLEEKIHDLIESKKALTEQIVWAGENWLTELDTHQLRDLLLLDRSAIIEP